jgi:hypothetical protein
MKKQLLKSVKHWVLTITGITLLAANAKAQLTGVKTIPGTYASVSAAISALNSSGVGTGGVTFNIAASYTETITATLSVTATGTSANPIVFQKSGAGANPKISSYTGGTGTPNSAIQDGIWNFVGSDYVTINGIDLAENIANTTNPATMEYGFAFYKNGPADGCQNNTIQNCIITLNRMNNAVGSMFSGSSGIAVINATVSNANSNIVVLAESGSNSNNKFYSNTIYNCNNAIVLNGFAAPLPYTLGDQNNDIGGASPSTGNILINFGGAPAAVNAASGVTIKDQWNFNVSYNTLNNNNGSGANHINVLRGIWVTSSNGANGSINNNTITLKGAGTVQISPIENNAGSSGVGNTISISNNAITNCTYTNATSGLYYGIYNTAIPENLIIRNNTFTNNSTAANSGSYYTIYNTGGGATSCVINKNTINGLTFTAVITSVVYRGIFSSGSATYSALNIDSNTLQNISFTGDGNGEFAGIYTTGIVQNCTMRNNNINAMVLNTIGTTYMLYTGYVMPTVGFARTRLIHDNTVASIQRTGLSGTMYGYYSASASVAAGNLITVTNNQFNNISVTGASSISVMFEGEGSTTSPYGPAKLVSNNTITNINAVSGGITALTVQNGSLNAPNNVSLNTINTLTSSGSIIGITSQTAGSHNIFSNTISALNTSGNGASVNGVFVTNGITYNIFNNKIQNFSATFSGTVTAMNIGSGALTSYTITLYNNLIGDLKTPNTSSTTAINGISLSGNATFNIYNNTVYINGTSTGANFGSTAMNIFSGSPILTLRNNIFINNSVPQGTGQTVALRRNTSTLTGFSTLSDKNIYYAGTPGPSNLIYADGTNNIETLAAYQTLVFPTRDSLSYTENVSFISTSGSGSNFLKPNLSTPTYVESGGDPIAGIKTDQTGAERAGSETYTGVGGAPDLGAIEGNYTALLPAMIHDSSNADQLTNVLTPGSNNVQILRIRVYGKNVANPLNATSFKFTTSGTTAPSDIVSARLYYTGNSATFSNTTQYGSATGSPANTFYITGTKNIVAGVNYFWLVYDVSASAAPGNTLDATLDSIRMGGTNYPLVNNDPYGSRLIRARLSGNYYIASGQISPNYGSINAAFEDLALLGVSAPVTFILTDPTYNIATLNITSLPINITSFAGASATNTVTLKPDNGVTATIKETYAGTMFNLSGVNYLKIDGRQITSLTPKSLIIQNDNVNGSAITFINDASNNRLEHAVFKGASNANAVGVINFSTGITTGNDNNIIDSCDVADALTTPATLIRALGSVDGSINLFNDNNTISNCNLYNFWHSSAESNAFKISNGNNGWTISGNSIYQTVARTGSIGYYIFNLNSGGNAVALNGFTIINNFIGGSAPLCTGNPWTISSGATNQNTYFGMGSYVTTRYSKNTMSNYLVTTTSTSATGAGLLSFAQFINGKMNIDSNTIGSLTDSNSIVITGGTASAFIPIYSSASIPVGSFSISGNKFGGIKVNGGGTNPNSITAISITSGAASMNFNVNNNIIGNNISNNIIAWPSTTGVQIVRGIFNSSAANITMSGNLIHNLTNLNSGTGTSQTIGINSTAGRNIISNNTIDSLSILTAQTGSGINASVIGIALSSSIGGGQISQNNIYGFVNGSLTANVHVNGIVYANGTGDLITRNLIHSLTTSSSSITSQINGLAFTSGTARVTNNMIRLGINQTGMDLILTPVINGITKGPGNIEAYFNTIYVGGIGVGTGLAKTYAFNRTGTGTDVVMNNIFVNNRSNGSGTGGEHFAVGLTNNTTLNMNFNIYHSSGTGNNIGIMGGVSRLTLAEWKTLSAVDASSAASNPGIINATGDINAMNLHIGGTTAIEGQGFLVSGAGVDVDYDGQTRDNQTPVDIGADGGTFTSIDLTAANITYNPLANTEFRANRIITATITDATGIFLTSATLKPRIYFKKMSAGSWNSAAGTYVSGTKTNSVWNFTIDTSATGALAVNDSVYYYIIAQDSAIGGNNIASNPSGADATDVSSILVHPKPNAYKIYEQVSGHFDVGTGQPFTSLTGPTGLFNYLNSSVVNGNITVAIKSSIKETGTVGLNQMMETGTGNYTIRIFPDAATERILYGVGVAMIRLNGADRVTFDGRYNGSGRYLKFVDTIAALAMITLQNDAHLDTFMYCTLLGNNGRIASGDFVFGSATGTGNDSNALMYCVLNSINKTTLRTGTNISSVDASAGSENSENTIAYNEICGSLISGINLNPTATGDNWMIYNNYFYQDTLVTQTTAITDYIMIFVQGGGGHIIRNNSMGGSDINRGGTAFSVKPLGSGANVFAISVNTTSTLPIIIDSNTIGNLTSATTNSNTAVSIMGITSFNGVVNVNSNTIGKPFPSRDSLFSSMINTIGIRAIGGIVNISGNKIAGIYNSATSTTGLMSCGIALTLGTGTVSNNIIRDIYSYSVPSPSSMVMAPAGIMSHSPTPTNYTGGSFVIDNNTVYNIGNRSQLNGACGGIIIVTGINHIVSRNRVYNINAAGGGLGGSSPQVFGIYNSGTSHLYKNNQISIGEGVTGQTRVYGIQDASGSGVNRYYYNSVFINGNTDGGSNDSYGMQRTSGGSSLNVWNNIFYNKRTTGGTGNTYGFSTASSPGMTGATANYNLYVVNDTTKVIENGTGTAISTFDLNNTYYRNFGASNTNWIESTANLAADSLFIDTAVANLGIDATHSQSWYVNGKGCAIADQGSDFNSTSTVRSVSIATGATDIGSVEITPSVGVLPPSASADKTPAVDDSTAYYFAGRTIAKVKWGSTGTLPSSLDVKYYSGVNPPNTFAGATYMNAYWNIVPSGGSGYSSSIALLQDASILGSVSTSSNLKLSRYVGPGTQWTIPFTTAVDNIAGTMSVAGINTFGIYTGTDGSFNPLPVELLSFKAFTINDDVKLLWSTASELNNTGFAVEHSVDGKTFEETDFVKSNGNSNSITNYGVIDHEAFGKHEVNILYYRLRQQDANGHYSYSSIELVFYGNKKAADLTSVYPNPFNDQVTLKLVSASDSEALLTIVDITGKELLTSNKQFTKGYNHILIDEVSSLHAGIYFLTVDTNGEKQVLKLIKQ